MPYDNDKDSYFRFRLDKETKDSFQALCKSKAINSSELIRQLIKQWINEQLDQELDHKRVKDIN